LAGERSSVPSEEAQIEEALKRAIEWQVTAPIRIVDRGSTFHGAIRRGVDRRTGKPMEAYTEITGYAISLFEFLRRGRRDARLPDAARDAAEYLLRVQSPQGAYADRERLYSFDTAMGIVGMARLAGASGETRYLDSALAAGRWLLGMQRPDGSFRAMSAEGREAADPGGFFGDGSCIHAKHAIALLELHAVTKETHCQEAARRVCAYTITLQEGDGFVWSTPGRDYVFTHAHAYACEGLIHAGSALGEPRFTEAATKGIEWLAANQRRDGGWSSHYERSRSSGRWVLDALRDPRPCDATSQAARLFRLAGDEYEAHRRRALRFMLECQSPEGGFSYLRTRLGLSRMQYTWCAQFAAQALAWNSEPARVSDLF